MRAVFSVSEAKLGPDSMSTFIQSDSDSTFSLNTENNPGF